jgi:hypothetical protein
MDTVSYTDTFVAQVSSWTLLLGCILFPTTFPQLNARDEYAGCIECEEYWVCPESYADALPETIHVQLSFYLYAVAWCTGILGWMHLWWKHQKNHQWLMNWIFYSALCNSLAGVWLAVDKVVHASEEQYSTTLKVAMIVPSAASAVAAAAGLWYHAVMFRLVKREHEMKPVTLEKGQGKDEES